MSDTRHSNGTPPTPSASLAAGAAMAHAQALQALASAGVAPQTICGVSYAIVPKDFRRDDLTEEIERRLPAPTRKHTSIAVHDLESLLAYAADQDAASAGYIYADTVAYRLIAVFNDNRGPHPGWRDHRCTYAAAFTPEFDRWRSNDRKQMGQAAFAEFIEDNLADLHGTEAQRLLDVATTLNAKTAIQFRSARRLDNGQVQLNYHEAIEATAGQDGALEIPRQFTLGLRIFRNGEGYQISARLKYRMRDGSVQFWYELDRVERAIDSAFGAYVDKVRTDSGYRVLLGTA